MAALTALAGASGCASLGDARPLREVALPLGAPWPAAVPEVAAERFLAESAGRRFVALGEGDHYVAEKHVYQLAFLKLLVEQRGLRHVGIEMGPSDSRRIDRYLATGDERWLDRVVLYGYLGHTPRERRDLTTYARRAPAHPGFVADHRRFYRALRVLGEAARAATGERLHLFGFDTDTHPGGGYEDARQALEACAPGAARERVLAALTQPEGIQGFDEIERLEALVAQLDADQPDLSTACGAAAAAEIRDTLDDLAAGMRHMMEMYAAQEDSLAGHRQLAEVYDRRERRMEARVVAWERGLPLDAPVALLGHNMHVARASQNLVFAPGPNEVPFWPLLGTRLAARFPDRLYVVWLLYARGTRLGPPAPGTEHPVAPRRGSLEEVLDNALSEPGLIFLRDTPPLGPFDRRIDFGTDGSYTSGVTRDSLDALVFLPEAHAPRVEP